MRRFSAFFLCFLLCFSLFPARAFASYFGGSASVLWSGSINDGSQFGAFVKGGTNFDAAVAALGYDSSRLSDDVKTRLADESYGGYFYTFAISFESVTPGNIPSWVPAYVTAGSYISVVWDGISGSEYPYWSVEVVSALYDLALRDFNSVLSGDDVGGTPVVPPVTDDDYMYFRGNPLYLDGTGYNYSYFSSGGVRYSLFLGQTSCTLFPAPLTVRVPLSVVSDLLASYPTDSIPWFIKISYYNGAIDGCEILIGNLSVTYSTVNGVEGIKSLSGNYRYATLHKNYFTFDGSTSTFTFTGDGHGALGSWGGTPQSGQITIILGTDFVSAPPAPDGQWPEPSTPVTPTAPALPEPASPTVETPVSPTVPAPVWPDVTINIEPDPTPGTTPSGLDYTELLTRINDNLFSIDSFARAINSNLNSLRSDLLAEFNGVIDSLRNIYSYLLTIDSVLETHCTHLRNKMEESAVFIANYMRTLIKWLADQLDFDDLTNVDSPDNSLLTTINEKLGGGTYEPNPIKDENGYYEWLDDLWDRFLLGDNWESSMGSISGSFNELKSRFPFSIPWDVVALFRLFVHDPVTPVFDLPLYFSSDGSAPVHVDLTPWDSVAAVVRPLVFVIFALKLALLSRDLLGGLGADKGGL